MRTLLVLLVLAGPPALAAQGAAAPLTPAGWLWRTDRPASPQASGTGQVTEARFEFGAMAPGWHVTMGPGGVLYDPENRASGRYEVSAQFFLFPEPSAEEYGVFVGGTDLGGQGARWTAFVIRGDGSAAVFDHAGGVSREVMGWTRHAAVAARDTNGLARNTVEVRAEPDTVRFFVNGTRVAQFPRLDLLADGQFGLRIGRAINIHITNLDIRRRLAPFPANR